VKRLSLNQRSYLRRTGVGVAAAVLFSDLFTAT